MTRFAASLAGALTVLMLAAHGAGAAATEQADPSAAPSTPEQAYAPGRVVVQWAPGADRGERTQARADAEVDPGTTLADRDFQVVEVEPGQSVADALAELRADPAVLVAERDRLDAPHAAPDDPLFGELWGLRNQGGALGVAGFAFPVAGADVDAIGAWIRTVGTPSTVLAVIDSGYRFSHPDLAAVAWTNGDETDGDGDDDDDGNGYVDDRRGYDFVGASADAPTSDKDPNDDNLTSGGHGAHVAGTAAAAGGDGAGITGVAQNARVMPLRVCAHSTVAGDARCPVSSQVAAINYAGANGARVANMSLGGTTFSQTVVNAIAANPQTLYVISAGNDGVDNEVLHHYPCDYRPTVDASPAVPGAVDNIVCVAATNQADQLASFSDWGAVSVDLGAPGTETLSAYPTREHYSETFQANDFASKWTSTGANGGFARTSEAPQTSFGISDSPGAAPTASSVRESTTTSGVAVPAGTGTCRLSGRRYLVRGGGTFSYSVLRNDVPVFTSSPATDTGGSAMLPFNTVPIAGLGGGSVKLRFTYAAGAAPTATSGIWLDDLQLTCYESATSAFASYAYLQGTSMAAPHVTGTAALLFAYEPSATVTEVREALLDSVDAIPALAGKTVTGGRLNASAALDLFDDDAPAAPVLTAPGPGNDNQPRIGGSAEERAQVRLYAGAGCTGAPRATVDAAALAAPGVSVSVPDNTTSFFSATATDTAANTSACSATVSYTEVTPPPDTSGGGGGDGDGPNPPPLPPPRPPSLVCKVPKLAGLSQAKAKSALARAHCALGKVTKPRKKKGQKKLPPLIVKSSTPAAGAELAAGTKVAVKLGPKPKPRKRRR